jgi:hypothetical protein
MKIEFKKCKNCNEFFSNGRSDKMFCHDNCRYKYHNKNRKYLLNKNKEMLEIILSDIDYFMAEFRVSDEVKRRFKDADINSSDNFEVQMEWLKHYDYLSRFRRIKKYFNRI